MKLKPPAPPAGSAATPSGEATAPAAAPAPARAAAPVVEERSSVNRRAMFGVGMLGLAAAFAQACSGSEFASGSKGGQRKKTDGPKDNAGGADANDGGDGEDSGPDSTGGGEADGGKNGKANGGVNSGKANSNGGLNGDGTNGGQVCKLKEDGTKEDPECVDGGNNANNGAEGMTDADEGLGEGTAEQADGMDDGQADGVNDTNNCDATKANQVDVENTPEAPDDLKPRVRFYGRDNSAMVAVKFNTDKPIDHIILAKPNGKPIALHRLTGADGGGKRPIVIDNVWLMEASVKIFISSGGKLYQHTEPKAYFNKLDGKDVEDLSQASVPAGYMGNQSVTQFGETGPFNKDNNITYPNGYGNGVRNLQTAKSDTMWSKGAGIKGKVTDIMGDDIDINGGAIREYQTFCTYVDAGGKYVRTILKIG